MSVPKQTPTARAAAMGELGLKKWKMGDMVPFGLPMHIWNAYFLLGPAHILGFYGVYLAFTGQTPNPWWNTGFFMVYGYLGGLGVTVGAHRLWTHKSYKANKPMQIMLMLMHTSVLQYPLIKWCRDHRIHHKYTDTNADPHSAARGFWFSHMGWVLTPEHPDVLKKEKTIPMSDLEDNPILDFQAKYYWWLVLLMLFIVPIGFMAVVFPQPLFHIICINYSRWVLMTHIAACVNSVAHTFGTKPYNKDSSAVENKILSIFTVGEAWHNYHHAFPYDYKTSELPFYRWNASTAFIDFFAWLGWATELKTVPKELIRDRAKRTGDGSHPEFGTDMHHHHSEPEVDENGDIRPTMIEGKEASWGWGDEAMAKEAETVTRLLRMTKCS